MECNASFFTSKDGNPLKLDFCRIYGFQRFDQLKEVIRKHLISRLHLDFNHYTFTEHVSADFFDDFPKYTQLTQLSVTYKISEDAYSFMETLTKMLRYFPNLETICINLKCNLWRGIDFEKLKGKRPILHTKPALNLEIHMVFKIDCEDKAQCKTRWLYQLNRQLQPSFVEKVISANAKTKTYHLQWHDEQPQVQIQLDVCLSRKTNRLEKISASMLNRDNQKSSFMRRMRNMFRKQPKSRSSN
ncbi:hypothetical protein M3Y97_01063000 [Aphelenchoides bicaudatus]|nr:hypothetical protein M3Y97_01063000 [Aphelenchoides bicaudatus]